jgi:hypothetical protein
VGARFVLVLAFAFALELTAAFELALARAFAFSLVVGLHPVKEIAIVATAIIPASLNLI